jgi:hypothetical protein
MYASKKHVEKIGLKIETDNKNIIFLDEIFFDKK